MNHWMWLVSLVGILSTAVVFGTDMFFLTIGRSALRLASPSTGTEIMGFFHMFADVRMPIWGVLAKVCPQKDAHPRPTLTNLGHYAFDFREASRAGVLIRGPQSCTQQMRAAEDVQRQILRFPIVLSGT
jgi:hypothetical protein